MFPLFKTPLSALALAAALSLPFATAHAQGLKLPGTANSAGGQAFGGGLAEAASNAASSASTAGRQADFIVAQVNAEPVTNHELQSRKARIQAMLEAQGKHVPDANSLAQEVLDLLIAERLQLQEAASMGIKVDDSTLEQAEQNVAQQNGATVQEMYRDMASQGIGREQFREQLRNQITLMRVRELAVDAKVRVSDRELDQYLRENPVSLGSTVPDMLNLGHILVIVPERASKEEEARLKARIDAAAARLAAGEDFATVAASVSDAAERDRGGELGMRPVTQYPELFLQSTANTSIGSVAGPVRSGAGYHLLKVLDRKQGSEGMIVQNHARHILITPDSGMSERQASDLLLQIRRRVLQNGEDFATLAKEYSQDASAANGGDLGWAGPGMFVPEFQEVLNELTPGDISQPIVSRFGMHLIQLLDRRNAKVTQTERREMVRGAVREEKADKAYIDWIAQLRSRAYIDIRDND